MKATKEDASSLEGQSARHLADRWGLPYREAHTLSIDPAVLEIVDREESKRLGVLPLEQGADGPVFAVAEPSEERFTAVRLVAGDNASFVVVAQSTLDALQNSKVFSVSGAPRRPSIFRARRDDDVEPNWAEHTQDHDHDHELEEVRENEHRLDPIPSDESSPDDQPPLPPAALTGSASALDTLVSQIATGAGSLRAQVAELTGSLAAAQSELREAYEQLADVNRVVENHNETVAAVRAENAERVAELEAEIEGLRQDLKTSLELNATMTARLEEVARALLEPSSGAGA